jgi:hypothetical protein
VAAAAATIDELGELDATRDDAGSPDPDAAAILTLEKSAADESAFPTTSTLRPVTPATAAEREALADDADGVASAALTARDETDIDDADADAVASAAFTGEETGADDADTDADGVTSAAFTAGDETGAVEL